MVVFFYSFFFFIVVFVELMNLLSFDIGNIFSRSGCLCWNFYPNKVQSTAIVVQLFTGSICHVCFSSIAFVYSKPLAGYLDSKAISSILLFCCRIAFISKSEKIRIRKKKLKRKERKFRCSSRRKENSVWWNEVAWQQQKSISLYIKSIILHRQMLSSYHLSFFFFLHFVPLKMA